MNVAPQQTAWLSARPDRRSDDLRCGHDTDGMPSPSQIANPAVPVKLAAQSIELAPLHPADKSKRGLYRIEVRCGRLPGRG